MSELESGSRDIARYRPDGFVLIDMFLMRQKEPLYRKVNTRTHGVRHGNGGEYRWSRSDKAEDRSTLGSMHAGKQHGLDYTPLFRFLLSKVGEDWDAVHSEAVGRLDREEPIHWLVARTPADRKALIRIGENAYYSGLFVDGQNILRKVDPALSVESLYPSCACCTHSFNGKPFVQKHKPGRDRLGG